MSRTRAPEAAVPSAWRPLLAGALAVALLLGALGAFVGSTRVVGADEAIGWTVNEYVQPLDGGRPTDVVVDGDGMVWSTLRGADAISRLDPATGAIETYPVPTADAEPLQLVVGPDGAIWFTELTGAQIGRLDPATGEILEYPLTGAGTAPTGITVGPDDALWFTDSGLGRIGRLNPANGTISFEALPDPTSKPTDIVSGPDGALWFTLFEIGSLGRMTTGGSYSEVLVEVGGQPFGLAVTNEGLLATNLLASGAVAFVTTSGDITQYAMPEPGQAAHGVATDEAGGIWLVIGGIQNSWVARMAIDGTTTLHALATDMNLTSVVGAPPNDRGELAWFTETDPNRVAVLTTDTSAITTFDLPAGTGPLDLWAAPDGHIWYTSTSLNQIGRFHPDTAEVVTFPIPTPASGPEGIVGDEHGYIWFAAQTANQVGRLDPATGEIHKIPVPTANSMPYGIIVGPDGAIWFTESNVGKLGRVDPATLEVTELALGPDGTTARGLTIGPDGAIWVVSTPPFAFPDEPPGDLTRVTLEGEVTHHPLLINGTEPQGITTSSGLLWWGSFNGAFVGSMTTSGAVQQWNADHPTLGITAGPDGNVWYGGFSYQRLGSLTPEGQMIERVLAGHGTFYGIATRGGAVWLSDLGHDQLVRYQVQADPPPTTSTTSPTTSGSTGTLPATGTPASTTPLLVVAGVLLAGGLVLALASRRRFNR